MLLFSSIDLMLLIGGWGLALLGATVVMSSLRRAAASRGQPVPRRPQLHVIEGHGEPGAPAPALTAQRTSVR